MRGLSWVTSNLHKHTGKYSARLRARNVSIRTIAKILGYAPSSISRELKRNGEKKGTYLADKAQRRAQWRSRKDKKASKRTPELVAYIQNRLQQFCPSR